MPVPGWKLKGDELPLKAMEGTGMPDAVIEAVAFWPVVKLKVAELEKTGACESDNVTGLPFASFRGMPAET